MTDTTATLTEAPTFPERRLLLTVQWETDDGTVWEYTEDMGFAPTVVSLRGERAYRQMLERRFARRLCAHLAQTGRLWGTTFGHPTFREVPA